MNTRQLAFIVVFIACAPLFPVTESWQAPPSPTRFRIADLAYRGRVEPAEARRALELYRDLFSRQPRDAEAAWRLSMACQFVGSRLLKSSDEKKKLFAEGREAGRAAVKILPDCAACHFWTAINIALYGQEAGIFKTLFTLKEIQEHLRATITLDPTYAYGGAHRVLGIIMNKLPGILGGSDASARENFEQAVKVAPDEPLNYLFLARLLAQAFHDEEGARRITRRGQALPYPGPERVESREAVKELADLAQKLGVADPRLVSAK